ncbi:unnamed protein product, partial [Iphiclides podalirius]
MMANAATGDLFVVRVAAGGDNARSSVGGATLPALRGIRCPRFHGLRKCQRNPRGPLIPFGVILVAAEGVKYFKLRKPSEDTGAYLRQNCAMQYREPRTLANGRS